MASHLVVPPGFLGSVTRDASGRVLSMRPAVSLNAALAAPFVPKRETVPIVPVTPDAEPIVVPPGFLGAVTRDASGRVLSMRPAVSLSPAPIPVAAPPPSWLRPATHRPAAPVVPFVVKRDVQPIAHPSLGFSGGGGGGGGRAAKSEAGVPKAGLSPTLAAAGVGLAAVVAGLAAPIAAVVGLIVYLLTGRGAINVA